MTDARAKARTAARAAKLLREAAWGLRAELDAAGWKEAREHPALRAHARLVRKIERFLERTKQ
jgi:hypothetical protein